MTVTVNKPCRNKISKKRRCALCGLQTAESPGTETASHKYSGNIRAHRCATAKVQTLPCGGPDSIPGQVMWNLWWEKRHWGRFSPNTLVSPANSHSTDSSAIIRDWFDRPTSSRRTKWTHNQSHSTPRQIKKNLGPPWYNKRNHVNRYVALGMKNSVNVPQLCSPEATSWLSECSLWVLVPQSERTVCRE
jgi:hypothetical protein